MEEPLESRIVKNPNWFQRHINWSTTFFCLPGTFIIIFANILSAMEPNNIGVTFFYFLGFILLFPALFWALKQKKRSLWWILILFVPFGWVVFLLLGNNSIIMNIQTGNNK